MLSLIKSFFLGPYGIFSSYSDIIEWLIISYMHYLFSLHLISNKQIKKGVFVFYFYAIVLITTYFIPLPVIYSLGITFAPVILALFIIYNQKSLQKHFIIPSLATPSYPSDWTSVIIQQSLVCMSHNSKLCWIIENHDNITPALSFKRGIEINAPITSDLIQFIFYHPRFDQSCAILIARNGTIRAINIDIVDNNFLAESDGIILISHPEKRTFSLVHESKQDDRCTAQESLYLVNKWLGVLDQKTQQGQAS